MACARPAAAVCLALLTGCAGAAASRHGSDPSFYGVQARLAARAASLVGHAGEFRVGAERFNADCTGFVEAVYEAEGIPLRALMQRAAPGERSGVVAAYRAVEAYGIVFGGGGRWPEPGDLVFWHDTYDRNRNGRADDGFTHVGVVESVAGGTVVFVHRGAKAVARGSMNPERPGERSVDGVVVNSQIRAKSGRGARSGVAPPLAGALFAGYGRLEPKRLP